MQIRDIFANPIEEKIEPVIKVGERGDERKLASEIGSYVVTPTLENYIDNFIEHYTDTVRKDTTEIGVWISGYFGSGKSHLAKILALLIENRVLEGVSASERFKPRIPADSPRRESLVRNLSLVSTCDSKVLAFNLNTLADSKKTPLPRLLLTQYYLSKGYGANFLYARVIEAELDKRGKLADLHAAAEKLAKRPWNEIQSNVTFYARHLYQAACDVAPEVFSSPAEVLQALKNAESGELYNIQFFVRTVLEDLNQREQTSGKPTRLVLVLDESGQWIEDNAERLAQLQALVEESAIQGKGKLWVFVTTHEDMGAVYQNARAMKGDMKKIEGRFRFKFNLTTENIELVLEDRIFRKSPAGQTEVKAVYDRNPGVLRDLGQLANTSQQLPECSEERFTTFYPFFPYQVHLIPEIVKSLRSAGGRGEQLSGSTRTLLAITQDILRSGRRRYLDCGPGTVVSFDEVYNNLAGEGEVNPDIRREIKRIGEVVSGATPLTSRVAEVLYLIHPLAYIPRTIDNLCRLLVENTDEDLTGILGKIEPELKKLAAAKLVAKIGEEYEFLTGERRTFEDEVAQESADLKWQDLEAGVAKFANTDVLGFETVPYKGAEFPVRISLDGAAATRDGAVECKIYSPLAVLAGAKLPDVVDLSLRPDEQQTIFVLGDRIPNFDEQLRYYLGMQAVIERWKSDPHKSEEAQKLASEREANDLGKLRGKVVAAIHESTKNGRIIFRGSSRSLAIKTDKTAGEIVRSDLATYWPTIYPKFEKVPVKIINEQRAIVDVLSGAKDLANDVKELKLFDPSGQLDPHSPLLDAIRVFLSARQSRKERTLGSNLLGEFLKPPYGWDPGAVRVGVAALVRSGALRVLVNKKPFNNPADPELRDALRVSRAFDKIELVLEESEVDPDALTEVRSTLIKLTGRRKIDETPAALSAEMETFGRELLGQAEKAALWAEPAGLPLPAQFAEARDTLAKILSLTNPIHRVKEIYVHRAALEGHVQSIRAGKKFVDDSGKAFTDMRAFAQNLGAIEFRLPVPGKCAEFSGQWKSAVETASVINDATWKQLRTARGNADTELAELLVSWREEARSIAKKALADLPKLLEANKIPPAEVQETLSVPLNTFLAGLDAEKDVTRVASLPERGARLAKELLAAVQAEKQRRAPKPKPGEPKKPVKQINIATIASSVRIENEAQWNLVRDKLDATVKQELQNGNDVELL